MFADAYQTATAFTAPLVTAFHRPDGGCGSMTGALVFLNNEGWALTAWHLVKDIREIDAQSGRNQTRIAEAQAVLADRSIDERERKHRLKAIGKPIRSEADRYYILCGQPGLKLGNFVALESLDLAAIKLEGLDPSTIRNFPKIRDPATSPLRNGMSLLKLGFPFHAVTPTYDSTSNQFDFAPGSFPIPYFPIEGILTRFIEFTPAGSAFPLMLLETSSAGLKGQSGGPILDQQGSICAIQSSTNVLDTGFDPPDPDNRNKKIRQFFSVGLGIHAATICGFLRANGIRFDATTP